MKRVYLATLVGLFLLLNVTTVMAGDGGGKSQLVLENVEVQNDIDSVLVDATLYLNFSNNVVNMKVKEANMTCFELSDEHGTSVDFEVFMGDDQENKDIRNTIEIRPAGTWDKGTSYLLTISEDLTSKNGMSTGEEIQVEFTTEGDAKIMSSMSSFGIIGFIAAIIIGGFVIGLKRRKHTV